MFEAKTNGITVAALPVYIDERSNPDASQYFWAYRIAIRNECGEGVKLLSRYWLITDGKGNRQEVEGEGVVGEQPYIANGKDYAYTSGCPLTTDSGVMEGYYIFCYDSGEKFQVQIPAFSLDLPDLNPSLN